MELYLAHSPFTWFNSKTTVQMTKRDSCFTLTKVISGARLGMELIPD